MKCGGFILAFMNAFVATSIDAQQASFPGLDGIRTSDGAEAAGDVIPAREPRLILQAASQEDPDQLRRRAMIEAREGNLDLALTHIERASRLDPANLDIALARGFILYWRGDKQGAKRAASFVSQQRPDYPELEQLKAALARESKYGDMRLNSIFVGARFSDIETIGGSQDIWSSQNLAVAFDISDDDKVVLSADRENRGSVDTRIGARIDHRIGRGHVYLSAAATPDPNFKESWSFGTGGEIAVSETLSVPFDLRIAEYAAGNVMAIQPGLRVSINPEFSLTARAINIFGDEEGYRLGGSARADYATKSTSLFLVAASYPDAESDGLRQLRSVAAGVGIELTNTVGLRLSGSQERREQSYRRHAGSVTLIYRPSP